MSQSTVMHLQPQDRNALVMGAFGPDIKSAIRGLSPCGGINVFSTGVICWLRILTSWAPSFECTANVATHGTKRLAAAPLIL